MKLSAAAGREVSFLSFSLLPILVVGMASYATRAIGAQESTEHSIDGYITAVGSNGGFDVNGQHVATGERTIYGIVGAKLNTDAKTSESSPGDNPASLKATKESMHVGVFVRVSGEREKGTRAILADVVLFRNDWDRKLAGFGVVERVIDPAAEPMLAADGYRIRIPSNAEVSFGGELKTLADVGPNTWVAYKGKRDSQGILVASYLRFVPAGSPGPKWVTPKPKPDAVQWVVPEGGGLINEDGKLVGPKDKVRLNDDGSWWHRLQVDGAMQARILRIGQKLVPAYQNQLSDKDPSRISFRFYAVDDSKTRSDLLCNAGLVLIPAQVVERLENDDQVAAVLADGIAYQMQLQSARYIAKNQELLGGAMVAALAVSRTATLGYYGVNAIMDHERNMRMEEQRGRLALSLMTDAGYDPHQAPEAWRRLAPKSLPPDIASLKYPNRSGYQLGILNLQYKGMSSTPDSQAASAGSR